MCQAENLADSLFCTECGAKIEVPCAACGGTNPAAAKFCRRCGAALVATQQPTLDSPGRRPGSPPAAGREAYYYAHDAERALASARQAQEISRNLGEPPVLVGAAQLAFGCAHLAAGRAADAIEPARASLDLHGRANKANAGMSAALLAEALLQTGDLSAAQSTAEEAIALCRRSLRAVYEAAAYGVLARALLRRDGAAARATAEAALASVAELIERTGAKTLAPALCEWRAELAAALGDTSGRAELLLQAMQGYEEIAAPLQAARLKKEMNA
ncbi:MAG: zinc ribbon domain-containing protein [Deltaproteobacteria bacterium]|nr:zinc ribbon domain-containing protein [Deltaproteobacteria bacterium]